MLQVRKDVRNKLDAKLTAERKRGQAVNQTLYTTKYRGTIYTHVLTDDILYRVYLTCIGCDIIRQTIIEKECKYLKGGK